MIWLKPRIEMTVKHPVVALSVARPPGFDEGLCDGKEELIEAREGMQRHARFAHEDEALVPRIFERRAWVGTEGVDVTSIFESLAMTYVKEKGSTLRDLDERRALSNISSGTSFEGVDTLADS